MQVRPPHHRVRLGLALRDARLAAGFTQAEAGAAINRAQAWINRLEKAQTAKIKMGDLDLLMAFLGIPPATAEELRKFARAPYDATGIWTEPAGQGDWWQKHQQVEVSARVIKSVHLQAHDGLIQSEAYMRRQFELGGGLNIESRVKARLDRQRAVLDQAVPPECIFLLDEACLHTNMGSPEMMRTQIEHLLHLSEKPHITILIKPFDAVIQSTPYGFTLLQFNSDSTRDFASIEYEVGAATIDDDASLRVIQERWEQLRGAAASETDSRHILRRKLEE